MVDHLLSEQELSRLMKGHSRLVSQPESVELSVFSSLLKHFGMQGEEAVRHFFPESAMLNVGKAAKVAFSEAAASFVDGGALALVCELVGEIDGVCVVVAGSEGAAQLLARAGGSPAGSEGLQGEQISMAGELLLRWLTGVMDGIGGFLEGNVSVLPQAVSLLQEAEMSELPFGLSESLVQLPVEWAFSDAASVPVQLWVPVDLAQQLVANCAAALRSGRVLPSFAAKAGQAVTRRAVRVYPFRLDAFSPQTPTTETSDVSLLGDVSLEVVVEIGRTPKRIGDILEWDTGTVVGLDKLAGESAEVYINGDVIARGEVMVVDGRLSVRILEVTSPHERLGGILTSGE